MHPRSKVAAPGGVGAREEGGGVLDPRAAREAAVHGAERPDRHPQPAPGRVEGCNGQRDREGARGGQHQGR